VTNGWLQVAINSTAVKLGCISGSGQLDRSAQVKCTDPAAALHYEKIGPIIGGVVGGFWLILAAGIIWYIYTRKKLTRNPRLLYAVEPLRVDHNATSWASAETNQPLVSQGNHGRPIMKSNVFPTPRSSVSQFDLRNETASFKAQMGRQLYESHGPVPMGSQADLRTEIALLRAQLGGQSNNSNRAESDASQVDLRTETASFTRAQMGRQLGRQLYESHGPVPMGSQADLRTEVALLRAQMDGQTNGPHAPMASEADLRAEIT